MKYLLLLEACWSNWMVWRRRLWSRCRGHHVRLPFHLEPSTFWMIAKTKTKRKGTTSFKQNHRRGLFCPRHHLWKQQNWKPSKLFPPPKCSDVSNVQLRRPRRTRRKINFTVTTSSISSRKSRPTSMMTMGARSVGRRCLEISFLFMLVLPTKSFNPSFLGKGSLSIRSLLPLPSVQMLTHQLPGLIIQTNPLHLQ